MVWKITTMTHLIKNIFSSQPSDLDPQVQCPPNPVFNFIKLPHQNKKIKHNNNWQLDENITST